MFKPNTIYVPFGGDPEKLKVDLERPTKKKKIEFILGKVTKVDPKKKKVYIGKKEVTYDYLIISTGSGMRPKEIKGLTEYADTVWTVGAMLELRNKFSNLVKDCKDGKDKKVLFLVPPGNMCSGPLYEMVQMLDIWLRKQGVRDKVEITWTTKESGYIHAFGPRLNTAVEAEFKKRGIAGYKEYIVKSIDSKKVMATDIMQESPPFVNSDTPIEPIKSLLKHFPCVLVVDKGKPKGIITNSDLLG